MTNTIHLQAIGSVAAKPAGDLVIGDVTVWNHGHTNTIVGFGRETAKFVTIQVVDNGQLYERRLKKTRMVGFEESKEKTT